MCFVRSLVARVRFFVVGGCFLRFSCVCDDLAPSSAIWCNLVQSGAIRRRRLQLARVRLHHKEGRLHRWNEDWITQGFKHVRRRQCYGGQEGAKAQRRKEDSADISPNHPSVIVGQRVNPAICLGPLQVRVFAFRQSLPGPATVLWHFPSPPAHRTILHVHTAHHGTARNGEKTYGRFLGTIYF
jgi:hypothetical protein